MNRRNAVIVVVAIVVIVVGIVITFVTRADQIVKRAIEDYGSAATLTKVLVDDVHIRLASTAAGLHGLTVANPPGFSVAPAVRLDTVNVALDATSLGSDVIVLTEVEIEAPQVYWSYEPVVTSSDPAQRAALRPGRRGDSARRWQPSLVTPWRTSARTTRIIKRLAITGGRVEMMQRRWWPTWVVELPDTEVTDIGLMSGGATGTEVAESW
jgi:hypothetical protein